jgi:hypothetical protein
MINIEWNEHNPELYFSEEPHDYKIWYNHFGKAYPWILEDNVLDDDWDELEHMQTWARTLEEAKQIAHEWVNDRYTKAESKPTD